MREQAASIPHAYAGTVERRQRARHFADLTMTDALHALLRRWWIVVLVGVVFAGGGYGASLLLTPVYVAEGFLVVDARRSPLPEIGVVSLQAGDPRVPRSEALVLTAPEFQGTLVDRLGLDRLPFIADAVELPEATQPAQGRYTLDLTAEHDETTAEKARQAALTAARRDAAIDWLGHHLSVHGEDRSYAITVAMSSPDPSLSAQIANGAMKLYLERRQADDSEIVERASASIAQRYKEIRGEVSALETTILQKHNEHDLVRTGGGRVDTLDLVKLTNELQENEKQAGELREGLARAESAATNGRWQEIDTTLASPYLITLLQQEALTARDYATASATLGAKHPHIQELQHQLAAIHARLHVETSRISDTLNTQIAALDQRRTDIKAQIDSRRETSVAAEEKDERIRQLEEELKSKRLLASDYETRLQQLSASVGAAASAVRIGAWATPPLKPNGPSGVILGGLAGVAGIMMGAVLIVLQRRFGDRIETADEIIAVAGLPVLGAVPLLKNETRSPRMLWSRVIDEPHGIIAESIRAILVRLQFAFANGNGVLLVTSAAAGDGKTSLSVAMAQQAALSGRKTLLIDGDLFRAGTSRAVGYERAIMRDRDNAETPIVEDLDTGLHILGAPRLHSAAHQTAALQRLQAFLGKVRARYDLIIVDTPPLMHVSDAALLAQDADGILLVASWDRTTRSGLVETLERVEPAGCPILGIALTKVPRGKENRYLYGGYTRAPMSGGAALRPLQTATTQTPAPHRHSAY